MYLEKDSSCLVCLSLESLRLLGRLGLSAKITLSAWQIGDSTGDLEIKPSFHPPGWMQWSLGGMYLDLRHYAGGMRTYNKHSFSFQACANMKLNPSRVLYGSSLCKNEPIPESPLSSFLTRKIWKDCRVFFPFWLAKENKNGGLLSALFWPFKEENIAELFLLAR